MIDKKIVLALSLCVAGSLIPLQGAVCANNATLATLEGLGGTGCEIGGLNFSNFLWTPTGGNPHSTPTDSQVTITTLLNGSGAGFLLNFTTAFSANGGGFSDGELKYVVKTVSTLATINSMYQQIDASSVVGGPTSGHPLGSYADVSENYALSCTATYLSCANPVVPGLESQIQATGCAIGTSDGVGGCKNSISLAGVASISVRKDIRADALAGATGANVVITGVIDQYGPAVPEPGTYLLSCIGLGLLFLGKRKFSRS